MSRQGWPAILLCVTLVVPHASAADRTYSVGSFSRIRVDGAFDVVLTTGASPGARVTGDAASVDDVRVALEGQTLIVRAAQGRWGERPAAPRTALKILLATPLLQSANVNGGGRLTISQMSGQRIDVSVNGPGQLTVAAVDADQLNATITGAGTISLAGRAGRARYLMTGPGTFDATRLVANDVTARSDGPGETRIAARYTAALISTGLGPIIVAGQPACTANATGGGIIECGNDAR